MKYSLVPAFLKQKSLLKKRLYIFKNIHQQDGSGKVIQLYQKNDLQKQQAKVISLFR